METLDERPERLYGPQRFRFNSSIYFDEFEDAKYTEVVAFIKKHGRKPDGRETAEILLGHELY